MNVLGIVGWSSSGKTTLLTAILPLLRAAGLKVSTIKHTHHDFDMDRPGKDSYRHREAGAREVLVVSGTRWALLHELDGPEPELAELVAKLEPVDLVLVEGYKSHAFAKLEVYRRRLGKPPIWPDVPNVIAVASDSGLDIEGSLDSGGRLDIGDRVLLPLNQPDHVAAWIMDWLSGRRAVLE
jgi:molybdopterin-guanine dinucleotide biosynthesis protein B